jgi:rhodanese-related sulfurtransferase
MLNRSLMMKISLMIGSRGRIYSTLPLFRSLLSSFQCCRKVSHTIQLTFTPEGCPAHKAVLIYCRTGGRSEMAAQTMQQLGYQKVLSMAGGFEAWQKA